jgi:hypothetical protein
MKRFFLLVLCACALVGNMKADVVEYHGLFISSEDAAKLGLVTAPANARTNAYDVADPEEVLSLLRQLKSLADQGEIAARNNDKEKAISIVLKCRPLVDRLVAISTQSGQFSEQSNHALAGLKAIYADLGLKY